MLCARQILQEVQGVEVALPLPRMTYAEAMGRYGCDKPDLRYGLAFVDIGPAVAGCGFKVFASALEQEGVVKVRI